MVEDDHIIKKSKNNKMPLNLARFLSDPRLYHLLLYCITNFVHFRSWEEGGAGVQWRRG